MPPSLLFFALLLVDSLHFVFAKLLFPHGNPVTMGMLVLLVGTIQVGIYGIATKKIKFSLFKENFIPFLAIGFCISTSLIINYTAIKYIDPGTGSFITQTGTIWGIIFGIIWLKDKLKKRQILGAITAVAGVFIMKYNAPNFIQVGTWMVLLSTFLYSLHTALSKKYGDNLDFFNFFFFRLLTTLSFLVVINLGSNDFSLPTPTGWKLVLLVGTVDVVISRILFYITLRKFTLSIHTIVLTLASLITIGWAYILFRDIPTPQQLLGGLIIIFGMLIINLSPSKKSLPI